MRAEGPLSASVSYEGNCDLNYSLLNEKKSVLEKTFLRTCSVLEPQVKPVTRCLQFCCVVAFILFILF